VLNSNGAKFKPPPPQKKITRYYYAARLCIIQTGAPRPWARGGAWAGGEAVLKLFI